MWLRSVMSLIQHACQVRRGTSTICVNKPKTSTEQIRNISNIVQFRLRYMLWSHLGKVLVALKSSKLIGATFCFVCKVFVKGLVSFGSACCSFLGCCRRVRLIFEVWDRLLEAWIHAIRTSSQYFGHYDIIVADGSDSVTCLSRFMLGS